MAAVQAGLEFPVHGPVAPDPAVVGRGAESTGSPDATTNGRVTEPSPGAVSWKATVLRSLLSEWVPGRAALTSFHVHHHSVEHAEDAVTFGGSVRDVEQDQAGRQLLTCDLWCRDPHGVVTATAEVTLRIEAAAALSALPLDELRRALRLGEESANFTYRVESNDVLRLNEALGLDRDNDTVPTTFFAVLDPVERRDLDLDGFLEDLPLPKTGGGNAFNEVIYERPLRVGDVLTVSTRYTEVYEKTGSKGTLLFRVRVNEMRDEQGRLVATSRCGHVLGFGVAATQEAS